MSTPEDEFPRPQSPLLEEWKLPVAFHFSVKVGDSQIPFCEVSGIKCSLELEPIHSGGDNYNCYYFPKSRKFEDLVLKRGIVKEDDAFFLWCKGILTNSLSSKCITPQTLSVSLLDENNKVVKMWTFENTYPVGWEIGAFDAMKNEIALETVTLKYYSFDVTK